MRDGMRIVNIFGVFGLAILFLLSSEDLRQTVLDGISAGIVYLQNYSPYSYVGLGLIAAILFLRSLRPRPYESSTA